MGADGAPACVCDSGFSAFDVLGQPACESKAARTACHAGGDLSYFEETNRPVCLKRIVCSNVYVDHD